MTSTPIRLRKSNSEQQGNTLFRAGRSHLMAQIIEYYVPDRFKKKVKWIPQEERGKIIDFPSDEKKSA
jgi:hypothetical protein